MRCASGVRCPHGKQVDKSPSWAETREARMRPVACPYAALGCRRDQRVRIRRDVRVRRARIAEAIGRRQLHPRAAFTQQREQFLKTRMIDAGVDRHAPEVVDHDIDRKLAQPCRERSQVARVEMKLQMPAERRDFLPIVSMS